MLSGILMFNELLGCLIMSFTSVPVKANDKNKPEFIISYIEKFYVETATKRIQNDSIFKSYDFNETVCW